MGNVISPEKRSLRTLRYRTNTALVAVLLGLGTNVCAEVDLNLYHALTKRAYGKFGTRAVSVEMFEKRFSIVSILEAREPRIGDPEMVGPDGSKKDERRKIGQRQDITRSKNILTISPKAGASLKFLDRIDPPTKTSDGGGETYIYSGMLTKSGYLKVDVFYEGHDAPGSIFINPKNGKSAYAHTGAEVVSISPDDRRLLVMNDGLNPPFGIVVASLGEGGPAVELHCLTTTRPEMVPTFKGWHSLPYIGFSVVLTVEQNVGIKLMREAMPAQFSYKNGEWRMYVSDPDRFEQSTTLGCWQ
jgi:hypothetical protein